MSHSKFVTSVGIFFFHVNSKIHPASPSQSCVRFVDKPRHHSIKPKKLQTSSPHAVFVVFSFLK